MSTTDSTSRTPTPDPAEHDAYFPSPYSLTQYVPPRTDFSAPEHEGAAAGSGRKILVIGADERYMVTGNGTMFSTGNHPVETLLPIMHLDAAGFGFDVATPSGNPVKFELWAMPAEDEAVKTAYEKLLPQLRTPLHLDEVVDGLGPDSEYIAVFIPGGHGAMIGLPESRAVKKALDWAMSNDRFVITLCHGPGALAAASLDGDSPFDGYEMVVFPNSLDTGQNLEIGYMPGPLPWLVADRLSEQGVKILNEDMSGAVHRDRNVLTGDSPMAANELGKLAANALVEAAKG